MYGGGIRFGVSFPNQSLAPNLLRHGWMNGWMLPFFSVLKPPKISLVGGSRRIPLANSNGSGWEEQEKELIVIEANLPGGARGRNETTATERRAGSMVRIRWAPGDRGEAPASSRFQNESLGLSKGDRERERERRRGSEATLRRRGPRVPSQSRREDNFNHLFFPC